MLQQTSRKGKVIGRWRKLGFGVFFNLLLYGTVIAQGQPAPATKNGTTTTTPQLAPVVVTATRGETPLAEVPASVSVIDQSDIQLGQQTIGLDESLNRVPGVFIQNSFNFAQDQRLSIRGFGTRSAFGVRELKVMVDGLPETSPDGQTEFDNVDLGAVQRIEVLRGPASSLYGNASGGVINITTEDGPARPFAETRITGGSFGLVKAQAKTGGQIGRLNFFFNTSYLHLGGYRDRSRTQAVVFTGKLRYTINPDSSFTTILNFTDSPFADDPGALTTAEVKRNRRQARALNVTLASGESVTQGKLGFVYRNQFAPGHEVTVTQYSMFRQFGAKLPVLPSAGGGVVVFDRFGIGGGVKYAWNAMFGGFRNRFMLGVDTQYQIDNRRRFNNDSGKSGKLRFHQNEEVQSVGPFMRNEFYLRDNLILSAGLRYDSIRFTVTDSFLGDGNQSGTRTFDQISPMGGILYSPLPWLTLYANVSTAFQVPTTTEFANPNEIGGLNPEIDPQKAINYEVGTRGVLWDRLRYEGSFFWITIDNQLVQFQGASGRSFFRNAGHSTRRGIETSFQLPITSELSWIFSYTYLDAQYDRYRIQSGRLDGNYEPGIAPHQVFTELFYAHSSGLYGALNLLYVDRLYADDTNLNHNSSYTVVNARVGYELQLGRGKISPFVGLNNLGDEITTG
ncbi:MAG: TonB-dependent receptor [Deltaproteobacteria bacterium]|nr:TonB-dependent receptor [Deltaproteobacteria bacterium]